MQDEFGGLFAKNSGKFVSCGDGDCPKSARVFKSFTGFFQHLQKHVDDKPKFVCDASGCTKSFHERGRLNWHKKEAHVGGPVDCPDCLTTFASTHLLNKHPLQNGGARRKLV